jgi:hypothetical protein
MLYGNLFSSDLLLLLPSLFLIVTLLIIVVYSVFVSKNSFSRFLVEDVVLKVAFSLSLFILLLLNQISLD